MLGFLYCCVLGFYQRMKVSGDLAPKDGFQADCLCSKYRERGLGKGHPRGLGKKISSTGSDPVGGGNFPTDAASS